MITVIDTDALYAANIANDIAALFDSTMNNLQKDFANRALEIIEDEYNRVISEKDILEDSLTNLTTQETYNYDIHINPLYEQLSVEISKNNTKEEIDKVIEVLKSSLTFLRRVKRWIN